MDSGLSSPPEAKAKPQNDEDNSGMSEGHEDEDNSYISSTHSCELLQPRFFGNEHNCVDYPCLAH
jgi:hypothetical protein